MEQAQQTVGDVQERGFEAAGERVFEETGSPLLATLAEVSPDIVGSLIAVKGVQATPRVRPTTPTKTKIADMIREGSNDPVVAKYKIPAEPSRKVGNYITVGAKEIVNDPVAIRAIKSGFDEGVVATIKGASKKDKSSMLEMVNLFEKIKKDARLGMENRTSDIVGKTLLDRYNFVYKKNREAGNRIEKIAETELKGRQVSAYDAYSQLIDDLDAFGVSFSDDMAPIFRGSDLDGMAGAKRAVTRIMDRINSGNPNDAYQLHRLKRYIDMLVSYGKSSEGLPASVETMLKTFRKNIDTELDNFSAKYNDVNTVYADTVSALDALQDVAGKKMDLGSSNANKAVGTLTRRLSGNDASRIRLLNAIKELEAVAQKYGANFDDDVFAQALFVDELDSVLGGAARTSFKGQIMQAMQANMPVSATGMAVEAGKAAAKSAFKRKMPDMDMQIKNIRELLQE